MKSLLIPILALLPCAALFANESTSSRSLSQQQQSLAIDTTSKAPSAKEWKEIEKQIKKTMPKEIADAMIKQMRALDPSKLAELTSKGKGEIAFDLDMMSDQLDIAADKQDYEEERKRLLEDFKNETFDDASEKREARREMKEELKELKSEFREEERERRQERKEHQREIKRDLKEAK